MISKYRSIYALIPCYISINRLTDNYDYFRLSAFWGTLLSNVLSIVYGLSWGGKLRPITDLTSTNIRFSFAGYLSEFRGVIESAFFSHNGIILS